MPEELRSNDPGDVWRNQPEETVPVNLNRRARELSASTRTEILMSMGAALLLVGVVAWRFASEREPVPLAVLGAAIVWVLISLVWFRDRIWPKAEPAGGELAATGLEHYRRELARRRDHLRNEWLWHGPLVLACAVLATVGVGDLFRGMRQWSSVVPLVVLLGVWTAFGIWGRRRQANQLQREMDEIEG
jgi:CHASE2 domain-containing sensor protein